MKSLEVKVHMCTFISSTQSIIAHDHGYRCLQTRYHPRAFLDGASFAPLKRAERDQQPDQISLGRTKTHMCTFTPWPYASHIVTLCPRCNSIPHAVDSCLVEAARLRRSGAEWDASFEEAGVEDTSPSRQSIYRIIGETKNEAKAMAEAKAEVKAEATRAKADAKWSSTGASVGSRELGPS